VRKIRGGINYASKHRIFCLQKYTVVCEYFSPYIGEWRMAWSAGLLVGHCILKRLNVLMDQISILLPSLWWLNLLFVDTDMPSCCCMVFKYLSVWHLSVVDMYHFLVLYNLLHQKRNCELIYIKFLWPQLEFIQCHDMM